jgi:uncharacterized protein
MAEPVTINLRHVARGLGIPSRQVQAVVELLDDGNTVPFITRYRKDQTGGLNEELIRQIQARLAKARLLAERKQTILRSIESQGKLTEDLEKHIRAAGTAKRLEDLYLPYKPKKQTLATTARTRGLEPLAQEILSADPACANLDGRAADFVNLDRQVPSPADALLGAGHVIAEQISERADLRQRLREILQKSGRIVSMRVGAEAPADLGEAEKGVVDRQKGPKPGAVAAETESPPVEEDGELAPAAGPEDVDQTGKKKGTQESSAEQDTSVQSESAGSQDSKPDASQCGAPACPSEETKEAAPSDANTQHPEAAGDSAVSNAPTETQVPVLSADVVAPSLETVDQDQEKTESVTDQTAPRAEPLAPSLPKRAKAERRLNKKEQKKKKAEEKRQKAFRDYFSYSEELKRIPPHRVLALNRGERAKVLRIKIECDLEAMYQVLDEICVPAEQPHADFLRGCARDALTRLILPALEREVRRELTERAENHAVEVFARNLRNLLLQPPVRERRVLAVDPGFKSGCKLVALDQFGNVLDHGVVYLVGKKERREEARRIVAEMIDRFNLTVVAIGNGAGCRETEDFFAEWVSGPLKDKGVAYVIVNEAGASVYSTSRIGREEFPEYDATLRGAISIGRRLQDPLSELVKIDPANIGVGLYQHDVKAKHLRTSLDEVVESCVNYVGVDVNTASPALLRYVSGLNQLTARRVCQYRLEHGPFRNRQQLREVPGFGEATFVQAAGFLKITSGDNVLDATWIHPESYQVAGRALEKIECTATDLRKTATAARFADRIGKLDVPSLARELDVGTLLLEDILSQLARPGRDPREDLPAPVFKRGVLKLEDLAVGMELTGTVLNVVDFGAFVDIGMHDSGLVHVSQLADKFVRDPHDVIAVGDIVKVWVIEVDKSRRRVSLTMIPPDARKSGPRRGGKFEQPAREERAARDRDERPRTERPPKGKTPPRPKGRRSTDREYRPKRPRKPVTPITEDMKTGKEPMRSFSDLAQFFEAKEEKTAAQQREASQAVDDDREAKEPRQQGTTREQSEPAEKDDVEKPGTESPQPGQNSIQDGEPSAPE